MSIFTSGADNIYADTEHRGLQRAALFWVTEEMCALHNGVAPTIPIDTVLDEALLIDETHTCGLVWFDRPFIGTDAHNGEEVLVDAVVWNPIVYPYDNGTVPGIAISSYQWHADMGMLLPLGRSDWIVGTTIDDTTTTDVGLEEGHVLPEWGDAFQASCEEDRRLLASLLVLLTQKGLSEVESAPIERAARRRAARAGVAPAAVRVIRLRRQHHSSPYSGAERHYSHRWTVRAHWRQQPYGPSRSLRKPVLVPAHVKGPDDAPLLVRETVRVL